MTPPVRPVVVLWPLGTGGLPTPREAYGHAGGILAILARLDAAAKLKT